MEAWKGKSYDLLSFMYHVCGNKIIVIIVIVQGIRGCKSPSNAKSEGMERQRRQSEGRN